MSNCLVTKLKGVVDNENLPVFGELELRTVTTGPNQQICIIGVSFDSISVIGGTTEITPARTPFDGWIVVATAGEHTLKVQNKYAITILNGVGLENEEDIVYLTNATGLSLGKSLPSSGFSLDSGITTLKTFDKMPNLISLVIAAPNLKGSLADLLPIHGNTITSLGIKSVSVSNFTMLMSDLGKIANINTLVDVAISPLQGSIESFVASQRGVGATEKSMDINYFGGNGKITWKGSTFANIQNNTLSWTATTITFNGDTIQNSDVNP